ncbi:BTAD domain-containing putative transcriptional regulator [Actinokineospora sp. UTMC 2448]|uniref:AfsR/SARP family transcriptional regulator n=1 Tax=Actinokineospora sp. UTMC 2448 TaxID=2268449 RepID=UPI002164E51C|nr:BTAD domain-containing putative transcriptional regulator [Actinokineospora sp. UTMC 2448]UVS78605.1 Regulatory protein AfsR [Actinokineospora sp. UTMC 2448]
MNTLFGILGTTALRLDDELVDDWGPPRLRAMLAALLTRPGTWMRWDTLTELMWTPDAEPKNPCGTLDSYASRLKPVLERLPGAPRVQSRNRRFRIPADPADVDFGYFQVMAQRAREATEPGSAAELAQDAIRLWRGPALDDLRTEPANRWRRQASLYQLVPAYITLLNAWLALDEPDRALLALDEVQREHPHEVRLAMLRISALAARGHRIDATTYFREVRAALMELGDEESALLLHKHHDSLMFPAKPSVPQPPPPAAVDALCTLPPDFQDFIGRSDQLAALDAAGLGPGGSPRHAVLVIDGPPGVGKSTLAIHWAHRVRGRVDEVAYFDLNGFADEEPVDPRSVIDALLIHLAPDDGNVKPDGNRQAALRQLIADRRLLVVLDNAANSHHVNDLLTVLVECLVLVASRNRLTMLSSKGAKAITVPPLGPAECAELLTARLAGRAPLPDPVSAFAAACGGLPLIVNLLADHLATHTGPPAPPNADDLVFEIGRDGDGHLSPERVFGWSYHALPEPARRVFRLVALHPAGDFSLASAAACAGMAEVATRDALGVLVGGHLLARAGGRQRYQFHDLLRRYARHRATLEDPAERARALRRVLDHYLFSAHAAQRALFPVQHARDLDLRCYPGARPADFATAGEAGAWFAAERTALVRAVALAAEHGDYGHAWRLADCVSAYLMRHGHFSDCRRVHELAASAARADGALEAEASSHHELGLLLMAEGDTEQARTHLTAAHEWASAAGHDRARSAVLKAQGELELAAGSVTTAVRLLSEHQDLTQRLGDEESRAWGHSALGKALLQAGNIREAEFHLRQAEYHSRMLGDISALAETLEGLAAIHRRRREWATAAEYLDNALALTATNDIPVAARLHVALAALHLDRGSPEAAAPPARRGVTLARRINAVATLAEGLDLLGTVCDHLHDRKQAHLNWTQALHAYTQLGDQVRAHQVRARLNAMGTQDAASPPEPDDDTHSGLT